MDRLAHHRHCVVQALSEWLDSPQLELAVKEWEQHYAHQPLFSLSEYARRHLPTLNIEIDANRLRDRVTSCLRDTRAKLNRSNTGTLLRKWRQREGARPDSSAVTRPENDIKPQNLSPSTPEDPATDTTSPPPSAHRVIFCALMANLVSVLNNEAPRAQSHYLNLIVTALDQQDITLERARVINGLRGKEACPEDMDWPLTTMQTLVHLTYVEICEAVGPTRGDRYLTLAVQATESLPESNDFSPRLLL